MGVDDLRETLASHHLLLLDTMVFSYHLGGHPRYSPLTREILTAIETGRIAGLTTTITLSELLTRPAQAFLLSRPAALSHPSFCFEMATACSET